MRAERARWLGRLPCLILLLVAGVQLALVRGAELTPWLGGGFGMFSTTRVDGARHVHVFVLRPGIEREVFVPGALADLEARTRALPSERNLQALGLALARMDTADPGPARAVLVQVWETRYDPASLLPSSRILRQLEVPLPHGG